MARKSALSIKVKEDNLIVLEDFNFDTPKTKNFIEVLGALGLESKKSMFVLGESNNNVYLASRNLKRAKVVSSSNLNTYSLTNANKLIISESVLGEIESNLNK